LVLLKRYEVNPNSLFRKIWINSLVDFHKLENVLIVKLDKNRYFIFIIITITLYITGLVVVNNILYIDYILITYICFIELGNRNNIFVLSIIAGLIMDLFYSPIIGIYLIVFFLFFIASEIYRNYVDFENSI